MATIPYNGFQTGFVTEGNPLQYPEGATRDELNFDLLPDGTRRKRLGLEIEEGGSLISANWNEVVTAWSSHLWDTQVDDTKFVVVQLNQFVCILNADNDPLTKEWCIKQYDISASIIGEPKIPKTLDFTSGNGYLVAVADNVRPMYLEYKGLFGPANTPEFELGGIDLRIRDFVGVEDNLDTDVRPGELTSLHRYNLQNQGWVIKNEWGLTEDGELKEWVIGDLTLEE